MTTRPTTTTTTNSISPPPTTTPTCNQMKSQAIGERTKTP